MSGRWVSFNLVGHRTKPRHESGDGTDVGEGVVIDRVSGGQERVGRVARMYYTRIGILK